MSELKLAYLCEKCNKVKECKHKVYSEVKIKYMHCPYYNKESKRMVDKK